MNGRNAAVGLFCVLATVACAGAVTSARGAGAGSGASGASGGAVTEPDAAASGDASATTRAGDVAVDASAGDAATPPDAATIDAVTATPEAGDAAATTSHAGDAAAAGDATDAGAVASAEAFRGQPLEAVIEALLHRPVLRVISRHDSTGVVYHVDLGDGLEAAFKPARRGQESWWRHEVAAFRLARLMGISDHVPPAVSRTLPISLFARWARSDELTPTREDRTQVAGAMIFWMPVLRGTNLYTPQVQARWSSWLDARRATPAAERVRAEELSSMVLFDYVQGNLDRFNFANIRTDENDRIVFRDNNAGWFTNTMSNLTWVRAQLLMVQRFSRAVFERLERADLAAFRAELARDPGADGPLLSDEHFQHFERRRRHALGYIRELISRHGEARVLAWP